MHSFKVDFYGVFHVGKLKQPYSMNFVGFLFDATGKKVKQISSSSQNAGN